MFQVFLIMYQKKKRQVQYNYVTLCAEVVQIFIYVICTIMNEIRSDEVHVLVMCVIILILFSPLYSSMRTIISY